MTDFSRLTVAIDSKSVKSAVSDLQKLDAAADSARVMVAKLYKGMTSLFNSTSAKNAAKEVMGLSARCDALGTTMNMAGQNTRHTLDQMTQLAGLVNEGQGLITMSGVNVGEGFSKLAANMQNTSVQSDGGITRIMEGIELIIKAVGYVKEREEKKEAEIDRVRENLRAKSRKQTADEAQALEKHGQTIARMAVISVKGMKKNAVEMLEWNNAVEGTIKILPELKDSIQKNADDIYINKYSGNPLEASILADSALRIVDKKFNEANREFSKTLPGDTTVEAKQLTKDRKNDVANAELIRDAVTKIYSDVASAPLRAKAELTDAEAARKSAQKSGGNSIKILEALEPEKEKMNFIFEQMRVREKEAALEEAMNLVRDAGIPMVELETELLARQNNALDEKHKKLIKIFELDPESEAAKQLHTALEKQLYDKPPEDKNKKDDTQNALHSLAGLDIKDNVFKKKLLEEQKTELMQQLKLMLDAKIISEDQAELYRKEADYINSGNKALADRANALIEQYDPLAAHSKKQKEIEELRAAKDVDGNSIPGLTEALAKKEAELNRETMRLLAESGNAWAIMGTTIQNSSQSASNALVGWMNDINGVGHSWVTLRDTVRGVIADMLAQMQQMIIQKAVMDPLLAGLGNWIGGFGSSSSAKTTTSSSGPTSSPVEPFQWANFLGSFFGLASGGSVLSGSTYLVGERGPELFVSRTAGAIVPNNRLGAGGGAGGASVTIVQNISPGGTDTRTSGGGGEAQPWANMAKAVEGIVRETIRKEQRQGNSLNPVFPGRRG